MVDFYTDKSGVVLKEYLRNEGMNDIVSLEKVAAEQEPMLEANSLTKEAFADQDNFMFPIYSKTAAMTSALYAKAQSEEVPVEVKDRIQEACNIFGNNIDVFENKTLNKVASEVGLTENDFVFPETQKLPMVDRETWEMSQDVFMKVAEELSLDDVVIGARRLVKRANDLGIEPDEHLYKMSLVDAHISNDAITKEAEQKFFQTGDSRYMEIEKVASQGLLDNPYESLRMLTDLDRENSIDDTKSILMKVASTSKDAIIKIANTYVPIEKVASINTDEWTEVLPKEDINFISNEDGTFNKEAFETLYNSFTDVERDVVDGFIQNKF